MISAHQLTRRFGARTVVDEVTFEVGRSEIVALLGPNGAGKTTTMRMLAGLIAPTDGSVTIDGVALTRATGTALRSRIGFLTEAPGLWDRLTVAENLKIYERVLQRYNNFAIARVEGQVCHGCFMSVTSQEVNLLMQGQFLQCKSCSRLQGKIP